MSSLQKPELRGHLRRHIVRTVIGAFGTATATCAAFYFLYYAPKQKAVAEFYRTYDPDEHMAILRKYKYLQSTK